ncbi:MAG TPA: phytanoyl-CoA dioxygenase family protein [Acidimicrobiales bacterium]|nr:phytanoyl-CoA dioxygenase family protein [Acidimicrobiales bacterium]
MLTAVEIDDFVEQGFVALRSAFPRDLAERIRRTAAVQLDVELADPASWDRPVIRGLVTGEAVAEAAGSSRLMEAVGQLIDPDAWYPRPDLGAFVVRFPTDVDPGDTGWHIDSSYRPDGDERWFVNYRSRSRGLLMLCLLSDVGQDDAPTRLLPGSHLEMPKRLAPAGEAGLPGAHAGQSSRIPLPDTDGDVAVATGEAGDVYLCHPFLVHAAGWPHPVEKPRFISQPPISLAGSVNLDGRSEQLSPVARAIRRGL